MCRRPLPRFRRTGRLIPMKGTSHPMRQLLSAPFVWKGRPPRQTKIGRDGREPRPACGPAWERSSARTSGRTAGIRTRSRKEVRSARAASLAGHGLARCRLRRCRSQARFPGRPFRQTMAIKVDACGRGSLKAGRRSLASGLEFLQAALGRFRATLLQHRQGVSRPTQPSMPQVTGALRALGPGLRERPEGRRCRVPGSASVRCPLRGPRACPEVLATPHRHARAHTPQWLSEAQFAGGVAPAGRRKTRAGARRTACLAGAGAGPTTGAPLQGGLWRTTGQIPRGQLARPKRGIRAPKVACRHTRRPHRARLCPVARGRPGHCRHVFCLGWPPRHAGLALDGAGDRFQPYPGL